MAELLKADGTVHPITETLQLHSMQRLVGGYIEVVTIGGTPGRLEALIVDEEGLLKHKPLNEAATRLYRGEPPRHDGVIVGDAVRCVIVNAGLESETYE